MKNAPHRGNDGERCDHGDYGKQLVPPPPFAIRDFKPCNFGSKRATFAVVFFDGLLRVDGALFMRSGRKPFVQPASIRNYYGGAFQRTVQWRGELARAILTVVLDKAK